MAKAAKTDETGIDLASIRERIDEVDRQIQALISERARYAQQVGISKGDVSSAVDYYRPEREAEVLRGQEGGRQQRRPGESHASTMAASRSSVASMLAGCFLG